MCATRRSSAVDQGFGPGKVGHDVGGSQIGSAGEAAIEMRRSNADPPEREIGEIGVKLGLRMAGQKAAHPRLGLRWAALSGRKRADERSGAGCANGRPSRSRPSAARRAHQLPGCAV